MCEFFDREQEADDIKRLGYTRAKQPIKLPESSASLDENLRRAREVMTNSLKRSKSRQRAIFLMAEAYRTGEFDEIIKHLQEAKKLK